MLFNLTVYWNLKPLFIMAKFELKFIDCINENEFIKAEITDSESEEGAVISITGRHEEQDFCIWLDKSTAIKFAKTLRTEINKITESEVNHE